MSHTQNKIRIACAGVGNLTSALAQGIVYYQTNNTKELMHPTIGGFSVGDIEIVAAFDIDAHKVGKDFAEAVFAEPNNKNKVTDVPTSGVIVQKVPVFDGLSEYSKEKIVVSDAADCNVVDVLVESGAEMLIIMTPSGSSKTVEAFVNAALEAKIGVINCTPSNITRNPKFSRAFAQAGLPLIGDDLQSQAGGTVFHKGLLEVLNEQGVHVADTYQLDVSGGMEGLTTLDYDRRHHKREVKENSISRSLPYGIRVGAGTTDYLDFLGSRRIGHYWVYGTGFMGQAIKIDIRLESDDGSNGAAALVDVIRATKLAIGRATSGPVSSICAHLFKAPPVYQSRNEAREHFDEFVAGDRNN